MPTSSHLKVFLETVRAISMENAAAYRAKKDRIEAAYAEANSDRSPTIDGMGRFHAPCDGYVMPHANGEEFNADYSEVIFGAGEFLPVPLTDDDKYFSGRQISAGEDSFWPQRRVMVSVEDFEKIVALELDARLTVGRGKIFEKNGVDTCYAYIKSPWQRVLDAVDTFSSDLKSVGKKEKTGVAPIGRVQVVAVILGFKVLESYYGVSEKMMVRLPDGATAYGTLPSCLSEEVSVGDTIQFTATFGQAENDETHAFFSRPAKATKIGTAACEKA